MKINKLIKILAYRSNRIRKLLTKAKEIRQHGHVKVVNKGYGKIKKNIIGDGNHISIGEESFIDNLSVRIRGNNNSLSIGSKCYIGKDCSIWLEGNDIQVIVGDKTSFTNRIHICAQEDGRKIIIGEDCMFSNSIIIRTSDSHPIYNAMTKERINEPLDVIIENHVWIAPGSKVFKGAIIHEGAIIGSDSLVTKEIPASCLAVGHPAHVVKSNIIWTRETLF